MARPRRILVVEDQFLIAIELQEHLSRLGQVCVGPVGTIAEALAMIATIPIDAAILNARIGGESIDPVCEALADRGVPFAFATGAGPELDESPWRKRPRINKPYLHTDVAGLVQALIGGSTSE